MRSETPVTINDISNADRSNDRTLLLAQRAARRAQRGNVQPERTTSEID
jgi:hypothetical protein